MRVSREQSAESRQRIIDVAGKLFRKKGFDGIGIVDIMKEAGLTQGGFYRHFRSKNHLAAEASQNAFAKSQATWRRIVDDNPANALQVIVQRYFSDRHLMDLEQGCVLPSLASEASRKGEELRSTFTEGLSGLLAILEEAFGGEAGPDRRQQTLSALSEMVGALVLARAVGSPELSKEILSASASRVVGE
jgi:TetR/AcrR family transcriptional repressor of nem operon